MPFSQETVRAVLKRVREDEASPRPLDEFLGTLEPLLEKDAFLIALIREKARMVRMAEVLEARQTWFNALAWYFARLFMWGALGAAVVCLFAWGPKAADPLTFGMIGAMVYYLLIQAFTPGRIARDGSRLDDLSADLRQSLRRKLEEIEQEHGVRK